MYALWYKKMFIVKKKALLKKERLLLQETISDFDKEILSFDRITPHATNGKFRVLELETSRVKRKCTGDTIKKKRTQNMTNILKGANRCWCVYESHHECP